MVATTMLAMSNLNSTHGGRVQVWQQRVLPLLTSHLATTSHGPLAAYLLLHDGAAIVSLLEVISAHRLAFCRCVQ